MAADLSKHIAGARKRLGHLQGLAAQTEAAERKILAAAEHRMESVLADLKTLRPRVMTDPAAGDRYSELVMERGHLAQVIAQARQELGQ